MEFHTACPIGSMFRYTCLHSIEVELLRLFILTGCPGFLTLCFRLFIYITNLVKPIAA